MGDLFPVVWPHLAKSFETEVKKKELTSIADRYNVTVGQLSSWVERALEKGLLEKRSRPVAYRVKD